jgi:hypothetical protein
MNVNASRLIGLALGVVIAGVAAALAIRLMENYYNTGDPSHLVLLAAMAGAGLVVLKGWTWIVGRVGSGSKPLIERIAELEARIEDLEGRGLSSGEVEQVYAQFAEMDSRMEFTERLLATRGGTLPDPRAGQ